MSRRRKFDEEFPPFLHCENLFAEALAEKRISACFDCNDPSAFTREWFAWANSLFALFMMERG